MPEPNGGYAEGVTEALPEIVVAVPALTVESVAVDDLGPLLAMVDSRDPLLFVRRGEGIAGIGETLRLEFSGPTRIADAARAWKTIVTAASVTDPLNLQGSGLVAMGTFAFADHSAATSVLIVPATIIGRRDSKSWVTRTSAAAPVPTATPFGDECRVTFSPGALSDDAFAMAVDSALGSIRDRTASKVVLARDIVGMLPVHADVRHALESLVFGYPDCFTYAIDGFVGSSPETLVKVEGGSVQARVLAGSTARGIDADSDLAAAIHLSTSAKDLDEHQYALASVLAALEPHCRGLAASDIPFTLKLPNLWHLASDVEGILSDGSTALGLVGALHPTAAVAGSPTPAALAIIEALEPFDRGRYAGPVGWVGANGDGEWAIALRCAQIDPAGAITAYAGAGIVDGSNAARELAETKLKFRPIVEAFS
jgi:menaquinone-specific isochorismate synthase